MFASMAAVVVALVYGTPLAFRELCRTMALFLSRADQSGMAAPVGFRVATQGLLGAIIPILLAGAVASAAAILVQTNFLLHWGACKPKFSRVNPAAGLKRLFGVAGLMELAKSLGKLGLLVFSLWLAARGDVSRLLSQPQQDPRGLPLALAGAVTHLLVAGLCAQAVIAAIDLFLVRLKHTRKMRMTK